MVLRSLLHSILPSIYNDRANVDTQDRENSYLQLLGELTECTSSMTTKRYGCASTILGNRYLIVIGGHDGTAELSSCEVFDLRRGIWITSNRNSNNDEALFSSVSLTSDVNAITQAETVSSSSEFRVKNMTTARLGCVAACLWIDDAAAADTDDDDNDLNMMYRQCLFVVGGHDGNNVLDSTERYFTHVHDGMWTSPPSLPNGIGRFEAAATVTQDNHLFVIGGRTGRTCTDLVDIFHADHCSWSTCPGRLNEKRFQCCAVTLNQKIYVIGGTNDAKSSLDSVEVCDTTSSNHLVWSNEHVPLMNVKRKGCMAAVARGCIYVFGGQDGSQTLNSVEQYNPRTNRWTVLPHKLKYPRFGGSAISHDDNNTIYIIGGHDGKSPLCSVEQFQLNARFDVELLDVGRISSDGSSCSSLSEGEVQTSDVSGPVVLSANQELSSTTIPNELLCPITGELMIDPVIATDGHSYERIAIEEWFAKFTLPAYPRSPITNDYVQRLLIPNHNLRSLSYTYQKKA